FAYKQFIEEKPKVVVVLRILNMQYWEVIKAGAEKGFKDLGIDGKVVATKNGTIEEQMDILKDVLKEKPDVLVVSPINSEVNPILDEFVKRNIPILLMNADDSWEKKKAYIGTDNFDLGKKAGILLASQLQPGDQVALLGRQTSVEEERIKGAKISLDTVGIKVVTEKVDLPITDSSAVEEEMNAILQEHPDLKGVVTSSDYVAIPALKVTREHGLEIPVTGTDGLTEMLTLIKEGTLTGTVAQNPYDMGYLSIEAALKVTKGEKVQPIIDSGVDIITKGNADQRLKFLNNVLD
ncbi:MAG TPA: sugar ABC transporter substrate-binding protein, partial [Bacillus sp. (in: firmicutes)]